uniref:HTH OST-type domain-containing protein n=1 Tax=Amphimedon queenslandica TaxID=400682 RepID=A0A1X7TVZ8_AMPQE
MLFEMTDIADLEKPTKDGEYLVFAKKQDAAGISAATALIKKPTSIPETLSLLVRRILEGSPPVPVHQFPKFFEKITTRELPLIEYGFSTVEEFLACIPEISIIEDEKKEKVIKVTQPEKEAKKEDEVATEGKTLSDTCTAKKMLINLRYFNRLFIVLFGCVYSKRL